MCCYIYVIRTGRDGSVGGESGLSVLLNSRQYKKFDCKKNHFVFHIIYLYTRVYVLLYLPTPEDTYKMYQYHQICSAQ